MNSIASHLDAQYQRFPGAASLLATAMPWLDDYYDDAASLIRHPAATHEHAVRESLWYALGLLLNEHHGVGSAECRARIPRIVSAVFEHQYLAPGTPWHGTFRRTSTEPEPPEGARIWRDYDPNWRQFIGTVLVIMDRLAGDTLLAPLRTDIHGALEHCVTGEPPERITASYTNIALMKAWLEVECSELLGVEWRDRGTALADDICEGFARHGAFPEYNSPTYYGINLYALGLWQHFSPTLAGRGAQLTAALWQDLARYYHAGMKNLCGPWSRSYGMDMQGYVAGVSQWIWAATSAAEAPFPAVKPTLPHGHDFGLAPLAVLTATAIPEESLQAFHTFPGRHNVQQTIDERRTALAMLDERLMIGVESASVSYHGTGQYHPLTLHWLDDDERCHWLRSRFRGCFTAELDDTTLRLMPQPDEPTAELRLECSPGSLLELGPATVQFSGLKLVIDRPWYRAGPDTIAIEVSSETTLTLTAEVAP